MRRHDALITTAIALALSVSALGPTAAAEQEEKASGEQQQTAERGQDDDKIDLVTWQRIQEYDDAWTADQLFGTPVHGADNKDIGEVENIVVGADGKIEKIIVEAGGFVDIGDVHLAVPWNQVEVGKGLEMVKTRLKEENVENFSLFDGDEEVQTGPRAWRATELLYDYVSLEDYRGYGIVHDLVFAKNGEVEAVLVSPDVGYGAGGPYAYPYYGYERGFEPGADTYRLPHTRDEIAKLGPFDYGKLEVPPPMREEPALEED